MDATMPSPQFGSASDRSTLTFALPMKGLRQLRAAASVGPGCPPIAQSQRYAIVGCFHVPAEASKVRLSSRSGAEPYW